MATISMVNISENKETSLSAYTNTNSNADVN
jgi:hypothetical protein